MRKNKGTGDGVHRNDEYTVDLSGAIGANSQQEIRTFQTYSTGNDITLGSTILHKYYLAIFPFFSSGSFILVMTVRGKHIIKEHLV